MQKFFVGDVVRIKSKKEGKIVYSIPQIISEASYIGKGNFEYATPNKAWLDATQLSLVHMATPESYKQLDALLEEDA